MGEGQPRLKLGLFAFRLTCLQGAMRQSKVLSQYAREASAQFVRVTKQKIL